MKYSIFVFISIFTFQNSLGQNLNEKQIQEITHLIPDLILENYVFKAKGEEIAARFRKLIHSKKYLKYTNPDSLSSILSKDLKSLSNDGHMYVRVKKATINSDVSMNWEEKEKEKEIQQNYGFSLVQILDNNIGYIKITEFMHPKRSMPTAVATMKLIENTQSLIIDLRGNGGGYPGIMEYLLNHYFDGPPTHLSTTYFSDKHKIPYSNYTSDLVYGKLRVGTPLYILIDNRTASASEYFAYTAQAFSKGIVVGEQSAGAAHMNEFFKLPHNFRISISVAAPIISTTNSNWETTGVKPNYKTNPNKAKVKAIELINCQS